MAITSLNLAIYIYFFCTWTQYTSVEEDRINKPDRPIPSGVTSRDSTKRRGIVLALLWTSFAIYRPDLTVEVVIHIVGTAVLAGAGVPACFGRHWIVKDCICMPVMCWGLLSAPRKLMGAPLLNTRDHLIGITAWVPLSINAQDFRDIDGDKKTNTWTLPIALGDNHARWIYSVILLPMSYGALWYFGLNQLAPWVLTGSHAAISYRFLTMRSQKADHDTYMSHRACSRKRILWSTH
ncbi:hypothetical protein GQ53DRAFT_759820 [Thozetella sp. PMI_491]|nr:hypothetical protein GQ53DRAFT_759820 [Thozetella sp. PMI_491]